MAATLAANPRIARQTAQGADVMLRMATDVLVPLLRLDAPSDRVRLSLVPPFAPQERLADAGPSFSITILPDLGPEVVQPLPEPPVPQLVQPAIPDAAPPDIDIARNEAPFSPLPPPDLPSDRASAVALRLRANLTPEMLQGFDLFLYVSKAERGPLAQRMYVFAKTPSGELNLLYDWAASTGREQNEISPRGVRSFTATPAGYYQLDPKRMYRAYRSVSWK